MKKTTFSLLFLTLFLQAQTNDFSLLLEKHYPHKLLRVVENYDRTLSAIGISHNFQNKALGKSQSYSDPFAYLRAQADQYGSRIHLVQVDQSAALLSDTSYPLKNFQEPQALLKTPDNGYFVGGTTQDGMLLLLRLSANKDILYAKEFGTKEKNTLSQLVALEDGGVLAFGSSRTTRNISEDKFQTGLGKSDLLLVRFNKHGTLVWSKKYGTLEDDYAIDALELDDGSFFVVGKSKQQLFLTRLTQNGDKIWLKNYQYNESLSPHKLIQRRDNKLLLSASLKETQGKRQILFLLFDTEGTLLKEKRISTNYSSRLHAIKELANGHIIGVGDVQDKENTDALFAHYDQELNLVCQEHFGDASYDSFADLSILHNSRIAAVGEFTPAQSQETQMWIAKINPDCTFAQKSQQAQTLHKELENLFTEQQQQNKLTIKEDLSFDLSDKDLYFEVGEYKLTAKQKEFLDTFAPKLIEWMYKNKEKIASFEINGHTSSEWGDFDFTQRYLKNEKLSMNRSYATLSYLFLQQKPHIQEWLSKVLRGSGYSFSKKKFQKTKEDKEHSRRVSFQIILK